MNVDPLRVWWTGDEYLLLDGHNRLEILTEIGVTPRVIPFEINRIPDRNAALLWIEENQVGRRNLTDDQRAMIWDSIREHRSAIAKTEQRKAAAQQLRNGKKSSGEVKLAPPLKDRTRSAVAKEAKLPESKLRAAQTLKKGSPALAQDVRTGKKTLRQARKESKRATRNEQSAKKATPIATVSAGDMHDYIHNFLTPEEADCLFTFCQTLPAKRLVNPRNRAVNICKLQMPCYSVVTNFRAVPNGYPGENITGWTEPGMKLSPNERTNEWMTPIEDAPAEILTLREKLSAYAGKDVNYLSLVGYADEKDHITWHKHREDDGRDATVYLISLGATRTFGLRLKDAPRDRWTLMQPVHGSLIVIPSEYNDTHEHAVLDDKEPKGLRISINTKCIPLEDIEEHARRKATNFAAQARKATERAALPAKRAPQIFDCHAGKKYPADAVYVGRLTRDRGGRTLRPDTPFGNHNKRALDTEEGRAAWAADVAERMKDPAFVAQLQGLRGKDLLCWCKSGEPNCHARTWLELANK